MFWLVTLFLVKGEEMGEEKLGHGATEGYGGHEWTHRGTWLGGVRLMGWGLLK